jgi:hypothetical protein
MTGITFEIGLDLIMPWILGIFRWHRKILKFRKRFGTDDMGIFVNTGMAGRRIKDPDATHLVICFENRYRQSRLNGILGSRQPAGTGPNHTNSFDCHNHSLQDALSGLIMPNLQPAT